ncbi:MAG TPA: SGNH/GDSL hydrolase family protein, partial [Candidatus Hydrogenedentes bacterium]|nr:SGNH/GDSL hydrolase family protein [Candidatus Hydrogenedentota bacterium]
MVNATHGEVKLGVDSGFCAGVSLGYHRGCSLTDVTGLGVFLMVMGRKRRFFYVFAGALWLIAVAFGLEGLARYWHRNTMVYRETIEQVERAMAWDMEVYRATAADAPRPPASIEAAYPDLEVFDATRESGYGDLAERWKCLILLCDLKGGIERQWAPPGPPLMVRMAEKAASVGRIEDLLPEMEAEDAQAAIDSAVEMKRALGYANELNIGGHSRQYMLPELDNEMFHFVFHPYGADKRRPERVAVLVLLSRFKMMCCEYRPNYYQRNWYPRFKESESWTNSHGFRDEEVVLPKPEGVYRIVCIGGSTTVGGPRNDLTYPNMLEQKLRAYFDTNAIEVVNCGVDGLSVTGAWRRFDDYLALEPDLVVHYNFVNDASFVMCEALKQRLAGAPLRREANRYLTGSFFLSRHCRPVWQLFMPRKEDYRAAIDRELLWAMRDMVRYARKAGSEMAFASFAFAKVEQLPRWEREWFRRQLHFAPTIYA